MRTFNKYLDAFLMRFLGVSFAIMNVVVFLQVLARNVLKLAISWPPDVAQLMFSWTIFIGAAIAVRRGSHYHVDLLPSHFKKANAVLMMTCRLGEVLVAGIVLLNGWEFLKIGMTRHPEALPITDFWFFLPIPLGALFMVFFLMEMVPNEIRNLRNAIRGK